MNQIEYKVHALTRIRDPEHPDEPVYRVIHRGDSYQAALAAAQKQLKRWFHPKSVEILARTASTTAWVPLVFFREGKVDRAGNIHEQPQPHAPEYFKLRPDLIAPAGSESIQCLGCESVVHSPIHGRPA
jgi:hypothetical protein